ncbi:MAG: 23S rRNA (adenine(2503)-C(2))-methyltransferase RlmN [Planctomycetota bacterium]
MIETTACDILGLTSAQFVEAGRARGLSDPDALASYRRLFRHGERLDGAGAPITAPLGVVQREHGTVKYTQRLADGLESESVILPIESRAGRTRHTLCVSSQIGCAMGCTFCETAQMGLLRNLTAAQIVGQWFAARFELAAPISNVVFMGMGEPMDNLEAVIQSIRVLADQNGPSIPPSRMTVSTVGRPAGIRRLGALAAESGFRGLHLAVSINAPDDAIRSQIMPINRAAPLAALREAMLAWPDASRSRILIEYVLIPGVNDRLEHADALGAYLEPVNCTVNVIPYNPRRDSPWPAPADETVQAFVDHLVQRGQLTRRRQTIGRSIMGACGQLGNAAIRRRGRPEAATLAAGSD